MQYFPEFPQSDYIGICYTCEKVYEDDILEKMITEKCSKCNEYVTPKCIGCGDTICDFCCKEFDKIAPKITT